MMTASLKFVRFFAKLILGKNLLFFDKKVLFHEQLIDKISISY